MDSKKIPDWIRLLCVFVLFVGVSSKAEASTMGISEIRVSANFTLVVFAGHNGVLTDAVVTSVYGVFAPHVEIGDPLVMVEPPYFPLRGGAMTWTVGEFTLITPFYITTGPPTQLVYSGNYQRHLAGVRLPDDEGANFWFFTAPPSARGSTAGPVALTISHGRAVVPDESPSILLLAIGMATLVGTSRYL